MLVDVITCNPRDVLYPWWMARMNKDRDLFKDIIIMKTGGASDTNFSNYIRANVRHSTVVDKFVDDGKDWRNAAINEALKHSKADYVLFLEQDFLVVDGFFQALFDKLQTSGHTSSIGFRDGNRLHPACLLVRKNILDKTNKDFSVDTDVGDHFYKFTNNLAEYSEILDMADLPDHYHLAGLTQNYRLTENWYQPQTFNQYNRLSMELPQHQMWRGLCKQVDAKMGDISEHSDIDLTKYFEGFEV